MLSPTHLALVVSVVALSVGCATAQRSVDADNSVIPRQAYLKAKSCLIRNGAHHSRRDPLKRTEGIVYFGPERRGHWASWAYTTGTSNGETRVIGVSRAYDVLTRPERRTFFRCTRF